jgi:hypothetical protein
MPRCWHGGFRHLIFSLERHFEHRAKRLEASGVGSEAYAADVPYDGAATLLDGETFTFTVSVN